jgi:GNAT superfamily N-acetyltransferase
MVGVDVGRKLKLHYSFLTMHIFIVSLVYFVFCVVVIRKNRRGLGLGRKLMEETEKHAAK